MKIKEQKEEVSPQHFIDESFRMDDNSDFSEIALEESDNQSEPLTPGVGVEEKE